MPKPIFLIGYMGSGKTTLGKKLASKLALPFIDTDEEIVKQIGMSITEYFAQYGEDAFRALEREQLRKFAERAAVISTGGGAPCFFDNMDWIKANGYAVYLQMSPKALFDRLSQSKLHKRPILIGKSPEINNEFSYRPLFPLIDLSGIKQLLSAWSQYGWLASGQTYTAPKCGGSVSVFDLRR